MIVEERENVSIDCRKIETIKITTVNEAEELNCTNKQFFEENIKLVADLRDRLLYIEKDIALKGRQILHYEKLIESLLKRVKEVERNINLKELQGTLNKHYEQSRRR